MNELAVLDEMRDSAEELPLRDMADIEMNQGLPRYLRAGKLFGEVGDPYRFTVNGTAVHVSFTGGSDLNTQLAKAFNGMLGTSELRGEAGDYEGRGGGTTVA